MNGYTPQVTPDPDLGAARKCTVKGKEKPDDAEWAEAAEKQRFFKVTVEMPWFSAKCLVHSAAYGVRGARCEVRGCWWDFGREFLFEYLSFW